MSPSDDKKNKKRKSSDDDKPKSDKKKKKRGANDNSNAADRDQQFQQECQSYYDRLLHQCRKELHKQAKVAKNFECQKIVRKIKDLSKNSNETEAEKKQKTSDAVVDHQKQRLDFLKQKFELESVIQEAFRRLGILQINPSLTFNNGVQAVDDDKDLDNDSTEETVDKKRSLDQDQNNEKETSKNSNEKDDKEKIVFWVQRILQHKRMREALEKWNDQVTEYRRWTLKQQDRRSHFDSNSPAFRRNDGDTSTKTHKTRNSNHNQQHGGGTKQDFTQSLFLQLGGGNGDGDDPQEAGETNYYGPEDGGDYYGTGGGGEVQKKNRPGQRARKAKAMAIQARKEGRTWDSSVNWRKRKDPPPDEQQQEQDRHGERNNSNKNNRHAHDNRNRSQQHSHRDRDSSRQSGQSAARPPDYSSHHKQQAQQKEELHPSWAARKANTTSIAAFKGTKITFDNDD